MDSFKNRLERAFEKEFEIDLLGPSNTAHPSVYVKWAASFALSEGIKAVDVEYECRCVYSTNRCDGCIKNHDVQEAAGRLKRMRESLECCRTLFKL